MKDLIEVLLIFLRHCEDDPYTPTHCEHDTLFFCAPSVEEAAYTDEEIARLDELGVVWSECEEAWMSYRFGSA